MRRIPAGKGCMHRHDWHSDRLWVCIVAGKRLLLLLLLLLLLTIWGAGGALLLDVTERAGQGWLADLISRCRGVLRWMVLGWPWLCGRARGGRA